MEYLLNNIYFTYFYIEGEIEFTNYETLGRNPVINTEVFHS